MPKAIGIRINRAPGARPISGIGLFIGLALLLPLSCQSRTSPSNGLSSPDAAAIKSIYEARYAAMRGYDADAYVATFASGYTSIDVTGKDSTLWGEGNPWKTVATWPKPSLATTVNSIFRGLSASGRSPEVLSFQSDGKSADVLVAWHEVHRHIGHSGKPYYYYRDFVSDDKWEKLAGGWVEKSSQFTQDHVSWSLEPISDSEKGSLPKK